MKNKKIIIALLSLLIVSVIIFSQSLQNKFTNWDDPEYVTRNSDLEDGSVKGLWRIATSFYNANYHPITMLSYWLQYRFFTLNPTGYHAISIILHIINCLLAFWFILLISNSLIAAWVAAILFAIHPAHVESVAWISGQKGLIYSLFFLLALICYIYYLKNNRKVFYYSGLISFFFSLLSKVMAITLPVILFLIDFHFKRRPNKKIFFEKLPFIQLALIGAIIGFLAQHDGGAIISSSLFTFWRRISLVSYALLFQLKKIFWPFHLSSQYPFPKAAELQSPLFNLSPPLVLILVIFLIVSLRYTRKIFFAGFFFLICLLPVIKIIPFGNFIAADRYSYMSGLGLFYLVGECCRWVNFRLQRQRHFRRFLFNLSIGIGIIFLSVLSWQRCSVWKDSFSLWGDVIRQYPEYPIAYNNRGCAYLDAGAYEQAITDFNQAIMITPKYITAYLNRARAFVLKGEFTKARAEYERVLGIDPDNLPAQVNLMRMLR
ncbi:MAG: hypothetical protein DRP74_01015 [Candidatus Omnitrophota bacterium]|nr:MAG: hypothetical protein DRP74_01015 [Candidatus Omnitrophota bacterium]